MIFYTVFTVAIVAAYAYLILFNLQHWTSSKQALIQTNIEKSPFFSILIPVRNEAENITKCLDSILVNKDVDFINFEIIVINDNSTDQTPSILKSFISKGIKVLSLNKGVAKSHKKAALNLGLSKANGNYIIQLDGDVIVPQNYLSTIEQYVKKFSPDFLAAPIKISNSQTLLGNFQILDCAGMMMVTQAGIKSKQWYMANGANMVYKKSDYAYDESGKASGDDINNIQSVASNPESRIAFLKDINATVQTNAEKKWSALYHQRIRWGTKNRGMKNPKMIIMMLIPFINALLILAHPILAILFFGKVAWVLLAIHLFIKSTVDYIYLKEATAFFKNEASMRFFINSAVLHVVYISLIGLGSLFFKKYKWKGRIVE
ncbi:MAG: glycosyltransferase [Saprospiraceae bacterium]|nr:glycosyltransferase [Bacteroidia bacterium]NNL93544.1 glycosyltransferase [Saprospiraceae bacterium]